MDIPSLLRDLTGCSDLSTARIFPQVLSWSQPCWLLAQFLGRYPRFAAGTVPGTRWGWNMWGCPVSCFRQWRSVSSYFMSLKTGVYHLRSGLSKGVVLFLNKYWQPSDFHWWILILNLKIPSVSPVLWLSFLLWGTWKLSTCCLAISPSVPRAAPYIIRSPSGVFSICPC